MRSTIKGFVHDTDKAQEITDWWNNLPASDFKYVSETLYRTAKGAYFLHGEGGALSSYRESCGTNSWSGGSRIRPMTESEASLGRKCTTFCVGEA